MYIFTNNYVSVFGFIENTLEPRYDCQCMCRLVFSMVKHKVVFVTLWASKYRDS